MGSIVTTLVAVVFAQPLLEANGERVVAAQSRNGRFVVRLTAAATSTRPSRQGPTGAAEIRIALVDVERDEVRWAIDCFFPDCAYDFYVDNDGGVVIDRGMGLSFLRNSDGVELASTRLADAMSRAEFNQYWLRSSEGGPLWKWASIGWFVDVGGRSVFAWHFWWGRTICVDVATGAVVTISGAAAVVVDAEARATVMRLMEEGLARPTGNRRLSRLTARQNERQEESLLAASLYAGRTEMREATALLKKIQAAPNFTEPGFYSANCPKSTIRLPMVFGVARSRRREVANLALRRLGDRSEQPEQLRLISGWPLSESAPTGAASPPTVRANETVINVGSSLSDVVNRLGVPDQLYQKGSKERGSYFVFEYDVGDTAPVTLRVEFSCDARTVERVERLDPPAWRPPNLRESGRP